MPLVFDNLPKVVDLTSELNEVKSTQKVIASNLLVRFDVEYTDDKDKVKHYPFDDLITEDELAEKGLEGKLKTLSNALWGTFNHYVSKELSDNGKTVHLDPRSFGEKPVSTKLGKIYTTKANRFCAKHSDEVVPYLFVYDGEYGKELMSEINFGIEVY